MPVDTNAIIRKDTTIVQIEKALSKLYKEVEVRGVNENFIFISFKDGEDFRKMSVSFSNSCETDYNLSGVWLSLGCWGNSVQILKHLCETFGGYLDENDCDDEGYYPINFDLYSKGPEPTKLNKFRNKVITQLGYNNLKPVMKLLEEYKNL